MSDVTELGQLADTVRAVLAKHGDREVLRRALESETGYDEQLWTLLCEQVGVAALAVPEEYGGIGAGLEAALVVVEELGRTLHAPPMLGSAVLGVRAVLSSGDGEACGRLLPEVAEGARTLALCWAGERGWDEPGVRVVDERLSGTAHYVLDGSTADTLIVVTPEGLFEIDAAAPQVARTVSPTMDPTRRLSRITFTDAPARPLGGTARTVSRLRELAWAALAAEQVGAADHCLAMTVEYTKSRVQFGRPIGSFQALKHRMADMYVLVESARSAAHTAITALSTESPSATLDLAAARIHCSQTLSAVAAETVQLHGGIAITWEHDAHLYFKRAHADAYLFGTPARPLARPA
ncbi:acyl-CoA/acyl-ACP dehydrogenase [Nocardia sp. CDC159]|uniref:Acyl-CoA/acyl-ACP dehydrogenase n=1 Tax=Nocardia pulmonis TaxID=2951408 RepID=A0A9X2E746_9NOCA|nr:MULTISPECIES: acyl-CoA dehydrogenase family protein [Nocardia]MCM6772876.1 acyl-CoA/acyl-ACP dehydrogenase [Nocardia pulmonis]MCM6785821.1 acyl-CoA/acyl-ACP dehydrogenase [Nocardia sp. CDC159]